MTFGSRTITVAAGDDVGNLWVFNHDGTDYLRYAGLKTVLDNLIFRLEIPELVVAMKLAVQQMREQAANVE